MTGEEFKKPLQIGNHSLKPGERATLHLPVGHLVTHEVIHLTVHVRRGKKPGPRLLVTAALHGDEINGVEIVRRLLGRRMAKLAGDLLLIPIVNLPAFVGRSRYLPDRRDLNRLFPGSDKGSFGARLAWILTQEIASQCTHGIEMHTGAVTRPNLPQIRYSKSITEAREMATAFGAPVMIEASVRPGSFREVFTEAGKPQIMYEGGEAGVLEPAPVRLGIKGVLSVMRGLGMLPNVKSKAPTHDPVLCVRTWWQRAPRGGLFLPSVDLGKIVAKGQSIGKIADPFSTRQTDVLAERKGVIIGRARNALIDEGDGLVHLGLTDDLDDVADNIEAAEAALDHALDHPVFDEKLED